MGLLVARLGPEKFVVWSNTVGAPVTPVLASQALVRQLQESGQASHDEAVALVRAADRHGTSDPEVALADLVATNRGGREEATATMAQVIDAYTYYPPVHADEGFNRPVGLRLSRLEQYSTDCPAQWHAWTEDGRCLYIRYRHGWLSVEAAATEDALDTGEVEEIYECQLTVNQWDGFITTDQMLLATGLVAPADG